MKSPETLVILDDRDDVRVGLERLFGLFFARVLVAATPEQADDLLAESSSAFLLCDYWLGPEHPPGSEIIRRFRKRHACLRKVALMTGSKVSALTDTEGADAVFSKPLDAKKVRAFFVGDEARQQA
ncbi:MAG TPA: response regulator [Polyangiaceae bacterium]|nr:response regulator [Polyangiaceae bacterium]